MSLSRFQKIFALIRERRAQEQRERDTFKAFRSAELGPPSRSEWLCPLCGKIGKQAAREIHVNEEHSEVAHGLKEIDKSMSPRVRRPVIFRGGSPGGGKRR